MPKISMPTIASMIRLFQRLTLKPEFESRPWIKNIELDLLEFDIDYEVVRAFAFNGFNFQTNLPKLHAGKLWKHDLHEFELPEYAREEQRFRTLEKLAEYLLATAPQFGLTRDVQTLVRRVEIDGYEVRNGKLIPRDTTPVDVNAEADALKQLIKQCVLPSEQIVLYHYGKADEVYTDGHDESTLGEWRKFLETLRDIAESTVPHRPDVKKNTGTMKDVLDYLLDVGFFDKDERTGSYGAVYGFFSAGTKPGIVPRDGAKAARILALTFGPLLLKKYATWKANGYRFPE